MTGFLPIAVNAIVQMAEKYSNLQKYDDKGRFFQRIADNNYKRFMTWMVSEVHQGGWSCGWLGRQAADKVMGCWHIRVYVSVFLF